MFDLLEPGAVKALLDEHRSGKQDNHKLLFSLVMLEQWLRVQRSRIKLSCSRVGQLKAISASQLRKL